jgi:hypothetical protein
MEKLYIVFGFVFASFFTANAQDISESAIGIRFGDNSGFGSEISYQQLIGYTNRLEIDFGFRNKSDINSYKATGIFHWVWSLENRFNWYAGFGAGFGNIKGGGNSNTFFFATGGIGIEYNFEAPFLISLDFRPEYSLYSVYKGLKSNIGLSLRYQL